VPGFSRASAAASAGLQPDGASAFLGSGYRSDAEAQGRREVLLRERCVFASPRRGSKPDRHGACRFVSSSSACSMIFAADSGLRRFRGRCPQKLIRADVPIPRYWIGVWILRRICAHWLSDRAGGRRRDLARSYDRPGHQRNHRTEKGGVGWFHTNLFPQCTPAGEPSRWKSAASFARATRSGTSSRFAGEGFGRERMLSC
jgi:hypothetical protein